MDNVRMPFLSEETLKTQRVEVYLNDLKERLKELRVQHDEVIQNSVDIIKEIDEVSSELLLPQNSGVSPNHNAAKIKQLIQEFETARESNSTKAPISIESKVDIRKILQNFEKLNDSHVLKESLVLFKRAKESLEKIDTFLGTHLEHVITQSANVDKPNTEPPITRESTTVAKIDNTNDELLASPKPSLDIINTIANNDRSNTAHGYEKLTNTSVSFTSPSNITATGTQMSTNSNSNIKDRINIFNNAKLAYRLPHKPTELSSCYASCCSSVTSLDVYQSTENVYQQETYKNESNGVNALEIGYEGDNDDSEYDLLALKRKRNKISSANQ
ncbi:uncharacterized protein LOC128856031 [Anastrepha ludens]|uniref:uncharacterized protein LOC128856031 n=1 Tax=Anastrepha ludens TaxID=28586 RepID=UPI0023B14BA5|nr:uncharacterized protein LOC128856031 [Anastrepha ludens]